MSKREKIILAVTIGIVIYGLLDFLVLSKPGKNDAADRAVQQKALAASEFAGQTMAGIAKIERTYKEYRQNALLPKIESPWPGDPFLRIPKESKPPEKEAAPVAGLSYTGYMQVGSICFAIINGMEYKTGETVQEFGFRVESILPEKVLLRRKTELATLYLKEEDE